ncbi:hypothetical protein IF1G_01243 [Cordyceps javanica]|uniref:Uncharacterized protein n=1 Tax=Cordyceps javanica TaxID=43265 RepID=A0A545VHU8_9HYPO|nr:hypothetical protein IF1G_01243 [Cordyceps javanica]
MTQNEPYSRLAIAKSKPNEANYNSGKNSTSAVPLRSCRHVELIFEMRHVVNWCVWFIILQDFGTAILTQDCTK